MYRRKNHKDPTKIHQALGLLNEAAREKRHELTAALEHQYTDLKSAVDELSGHVKENTDHLKKKTINALHEGEEYVEQKVMETAEEVDRSVHEHPWYFLGGVAITSFLVGYGLSQKNGKHKKK